MKKNETSVEELSKALEYLDSFAKGKGQEPIGQQNGGDNNPPKDNPDGEGGDKGAGDEPDDELYAAHKKRMSAYIDKAMAHKGYMESIKKGDPLPDGAFDDLDDDEPANGGEGGGNNPDKGGEGDGGSVQKGLTFEELEKSEQFEELVKSKVSAEIDAVKDHYEEIIKGLKDEMSKIANEPVRKTLIKGADAVTLKAAISGEKIDDKTVLSISLQKGKVSEALYNAYENEKDSMVKGVLGEAVAQFECTGNFISSEVAEIMDSKGFKFIQ